MKNILVPILEWDQVASPEANRFIVHFEMASFVDESWLSEFTEHIFTSIWQQRHEWTVAS